MGRILSPQSRSDFLPLRHFVTVTVRLAIVYQQADFTTSRLRRTPPIHFVAGGELWPWWAFLYPLNRGAIFTP